MKTNTLYIIAVVLIILYVIMYMKRSRNEGFINPINIGRCGPNLGVCPAPLRCMNGYCKSDIAPKLPKYSDLPIVPPRYTDELTLQQQVNSHLI